MGSLTWRACGKSHVESLWGVSRGEPVGSLTWRAYGGSHVHKSTSCTLGKELGLSWIGAQKVFDTREAKPTWAPVDTVGGQSLYGNPFNVQVCL